MKWLEENTKWIVLGLVTVSSGLAILFNGLGNNALFYTCVFIASLIVLVKGADFLVDGASLLAEHKGVSPLVIGLTVVAFGTSLPELVVSTYANLVGSSGISLGNIIGSNLSNIAVILGLSACISSIIIKKETLGFDMKFMLFVSFLLFFLCFGFFEFSSSPVLGTIDGLILLFLFAYFLYRMFNDAEKQKKLHILAHEKKPKIQRDLMLVTAGIAGVVVGGKFLVESGRSLAELFGVPEIIIGLTLIAVGTSLPELATNVIASFKKRYEISVGNIVGSNIFNILMVLGIASVLKPVPVPAQALCIDIPFMLFVSVLLFAFMRTGYKISRKEGFTLILFYVLYLGYIFTAIGARA